VLVVIALAHLTRAATYMCSICTSEFDDAGGLLVHCAKEDECDLGARCLSPRCKKGARWHLEAATNQRHPMGTDEFVGEVVPDHELVAAREPLHSHIGRNSGVSRSLRLSFALIVTAVWSALTDSGSVVVGEEDMGAGVWVLLAVIFGVGAGAVIAWIMSHAAMMGTEDNSILFLVQKDNPILFQTRRFESGVWSHVAYTACEVLLLGTLAYSIPRGYGSDIVVASLFLAGVGSAAIAGRFVVEIVRQVRGAEGKSIRGCKLAIVAATAASTIVLIVVLMVFPMLVRSTGLSLPAAWLVSAHLVVCVATLPMLALF
jgi:hypothetical protein